MDFNGSKEDNNSNLNPIEPSFLNYKRIPDALDSFDDLTVNAVKNTNVESSLLSEWPSNANKTRFEKYGIHKKNPQRFSKKMDEENTLELSLLAELPELATKEGALLDLNRMIPQPFHQE